jgi:hypothetical protein
VTLALDDEGADREIACPSCGRTFRYVSGFVYRDGDAHAIYHAQCHGHDTRDEVWLDLVVGEWEPDYQDQFTFSCRVSTTGAGLVDAPVASSGQAEYFGAKLSRTEALEHERLAQVWELVDFVLTTDPTISDYIYGPTP